MQSVNWIEIATLALAMTLWQPRVVALRDIGIRNPGIHAWEMSDRNVLLSSLLQVLL
jgi:hypothetical protein